MVNGDEKTGLFKEIDGSDETLIKTDSGFEKAVFTSAEVEAEAREAGTQALTGDITPVATVRRRARGRKRVVAVQPTQPAPTIIQQPPIIEPDTSGIQQAELETRRQLLRQQQIITAETQRQIRRDVPRFQETVPRRRAEDQLFIREGVPFGDVRETEFAFPERAGRALSIAGLDELVGPTLFGLGVVSGGVRTVQDIVGTAGFSLVEGTAELITQPRKVIRETGVRLRQDPFSAGEVVGELTVSGLISGGIAKGLPRGIRAARTSIFERRIRTRPEQLTPSQFDPSTGFIDIMGVKQTQLFPKSIDIAKAVGQVQESGLKKRIQTIDILDINKPFEVSEGVQALRQIQFEGQTILPRPQEFLLRRRETGFRVEVVNPFEAIQVTTKKGIETIIAERPLAQREAGALLAIERGRIIREAREVLPEVQRKLPEMGFEPLGDIVIKELGVTPRGGLFIGRRGQVGLGGISELIFDPLGKALERFDLFDEKITPRETRFTREGEFRARDPITLQPRIITPSQDIVTSLIDVKGIITEEAIITKEKLDIISIQDVVPIQDVVQIPKQISKIRQKQETIQELIQETKQIQTLKLTTPQILTTPTTLTTLQILTTPTILTPRLRPPRIPVPSITPPIFGIIRGKERMIEDLFSVEVRREGKFTSIGKTSSLFSAFNLGDRRVDRTAAASFRIRNIGTGEIEEDGLFDLLLPSRIRRSKKEPGVFIERREKRISTFGELQQITFKGIEATRGRRKGRGGDIFGI